MNRKLYDINRVGEDEINRVVSVKEAAERFHRSSRTIHYHIRCGNVAARMIGRDYAISLSSLENYFSRLDT